MLKIRDRFQSPRYAVRPLFDYLKKDWVIWECAAGDGNISIELGEHGYNVVSTDIIFGQDFLTTKPPKYDCIVTNPPWSVRNEFLRRAYELGKPFAFLLPLVTLDTAGRQKMFKDNGIELISLDKRIEFNSEEHGWRSSRTVTAWFTWQLTDSMISYANIVK